MLAMLWVTLLTLLLWSSTCCGYHIVSTKGLVFASNYSYWVYEPYNKVRIILITLKGDADLYIAKGYDKPTVDLDAHQLQSVSCGIDIVDVPENFSPTGIFSIGVYGHPSYDYSVFQVDIISYEEGEDISAHENGSIDLSDKAEVARLAWLIEESITNEKNDENDGETSRREEHDENDRESFLTNLLHIFFDIIIFIIDVIS